jgi:hypothetical protein
MPALLSAVRAHGPKPAPRAPRSRLGLDENLDPIAGRFSPTRVAASLFVFICAACSTSNGGSPDAGAPRVPIVHRAAAEACSSTPVGAEPMPGSTNLTNDCARNEDCKAGMNGRCIFTFPMGVDKCFYDQCLTDADCGREVCACSSEQLAITNACKGGDCKTDGDCAGSYCSPSVDCSGVSGFFCHGRSDECVNDDDCRHDANAMFNKCAYDYAAAYWKCVSLACAN